MADTLGDSRTERADAPSPSRNENRGREGSRPLGPPPTRQHLDRRRSRNDKSRLGKESL
jgi:hypothetical protein